MDYYTINKLLKTGKNVGDCKNYIYLKIKWDDEQFEIKMLDSESGKSYKGIVNTTTLQEVAANFDMSLKDYYKEVRSALSTYLALPGFYYKIEPEMQVLNIWKSQPESVPILFLDINIEEVRNQNEILDSAVELLQQQAISLKDRVQKAHKFDEHSRELLQDYRQCVEEKNGLEKKILKKVAVLLNAKKERIAQLEGRLKMYEKVEDNADSEESDNAYENCKKRRLVQIDSESENDEYMENTQPLSVPNDAENV